MGGTDILSYSIKISCVSLWLLITSCMFGDCGEKPFYPPPRKMQLKAIKIFSRVLSSYVKHMCPWEKYVLPRTPRRKLRYKQEWDSVGGRGGEGSTPSPGFRKPLKSKWWTMVRATLGDATFSNQDASLSMQVTFDQMRERSLSPAGKEKEGSSTDLSKPKG